MNTRDKIIALLSKSREPLGAKKIAAELKRTNANIRKILSNLCKEEMVVRVSFGKYLLSVNVSNKSVNVSNKSVNVSNKSVNVADKKVNIYTPRARRKEDPFEQEKWERI